MEKDKVSSAGVKADTENVACKNTKKNPKELKLNIMATIKLQKLFRGYKERHKYRRKALAAAWDELEHKEESELHYSAKEIGSMTEMYKKLVPTSIVSDEDKKRRPSIVGTPKVDKDFKVSLSWLTSLMDKISKSIPLKEKPIPDHELKMIMTKTKDELDKLPNVVQIVLEKDQTCVIVGDLHGQVRDLLHILRICGFPSAKKYFLFNGDFVDRGHHSCETTIVIFALKILYPDWVFMNRGNHEANDINSRDGFQAECILKYDIDIYKQFNETFAALPLMHILNKETMVVHGGLCWDAGITINTIGKINRKVLAPVWESVMEDLLWSDPGNAKHCGATQNDRGCGCIFGEDIVDEFFEDNPPLRMIIRSHEKKETGFEKHFHGKVLTVFSASNYCGDNGNDGSVLEIKADGKYQVHSYYAETDEKKGREAQSFSDRYSTLANSVAAKLIQRIAENRLRLIDFYDSCVASRESKKAQTGEAQVDEAKTLITRSEWATGLREVLQLRIRFLFLQDLLGVPLKGVKGKNKGRFDYMAWLNKFAPINLKLVEDKGAKKEIKETLQKITTILLRHRVAINSMFRFFDSNGDGKITRTEMSNGLSCLGKVYNESFSQSEVDTLVKYLDVDNDDSIDFQEFLKTFSVSNSNLAKTLNATSIHSRMRGGIIKPENISRRPSRFCKNKPAKN